MITLFIRSMPTAGCSNLGHAILHILEHYSLIFTIILDLELFSSMHIHIRVQCEDYGKWVNILKYIKLVKIKAQRDNIPDHINSSIVSLL